VTQFGLSVRRHRAAAVDVRVDQGCQGLGRASMTGSRSSRNLETTPILEWSWKIIETPAGADVRKRGTSDLTVHLVVVWPRFPEALRSRLIAYAWGSIEPAGTIERSRKTSTVTFFILRSGSENLGRWLTERRNVVDDYRRVYGERPEESPKAIAVSIDTNDTHSRSAALIGPIAFTGP
jgi:Protein of unknown function (DUF3047)